MLTTKYSVSLSNNSFQKMISIKANSKKCEAVLLDAVKMSPRAQTL